MTQAGPAGAAGSTTPCGNAPDGYNVIESNAAEIIGTEGNDWICAGAGSNTILALGGDDIVFGRKGKDTLYGGGGDDRLDGGPHDDALFGEAGNDRLVGGTNADLLDGGEGRDILGGRKGNDILRGGPGNDVLRGGPQGDQIQGGAGRDIVSGGTGPDRIRGGDGPDILRGDAGADIINGDLGNDWIHGRSGIDRCTGGRIEKACETIGPDLLDTSFAVKDRREVKSHDRHASDTFTPNNTVRITIFAGPDRTTTLGAPLVEPTDAAGDWSTGWIPTMPVGTIVQVEDVGTGYVSDLTITVSIDELDTASTTVRGTAPEGTVINFLLTPYLHNAYDLDSRNVVLHGRGEGTSNGTFGTFLYRLGTELQMLEYEVETTEPNVQIGDRILDRAQPTISVDQTGVASLPGGWSPGATLDIHLNGERRHTLVAGIFGEFWQPISFIEEGDVVRVVERGSDRTAETTYVSAFVTGRFEFGDHIVIGLEPDLGPHMIRTFRSDGSYRVTHRSQPNWFGFDLADFTYAYIEYIDANGNLIGEYLRLVE